MIIDNFEQIKRLMKFEDKDDFYFLQIIQRKKDGCNVYDSGSNGYRRVKTYYITSIEDLEKRKDKIIELCKSNNARAYIHLNVRSAKEVALNAAKAYIDLVREDRCNQGYRIYDHVCGVTPKMGVKKKWIVDVDTKDIDKVKRLCDAICKCRSAYHWNAVNDTYDNIIDKIPTPHGVHIITHRFDVGHFKSYLNENLSDIFTVEEIKEICAVKEDNPTILYFEKND